MFLGLLPDPPEGRLVEDEEAALEIALMMKAIPPPSQYIPPSQEAILDSWM